MSEKPDELPLDDPRTVLHWFDFVCPFCYVGQSRDAILEKHGLTVVQLPFQIHPEIPTGGIPAGARSGEMYTMLEREAAEAGLPLNWPPRLPNTRVALAVAEWTRENAPDAAAALNSSLFTAHFAQGEDLGDASVIDRYAAEAGVDLPALHSALEDGSAPGLSQSEALARRLGVQATPVWLIAGQMVVGLQPPHVFEALAGAAAGTGPVS